MILAVCDACQLHGVYSVSEFRCFHQKVDTQKTHYGKKESNQVPEWCPLKIKYRFPYHIYVPKESHGIYP